MLSSLRISSRLPATHMHQSTAEKGSKFFLVIRDTSSLGLAQKCGSQADSTKAELLRKENSTLGKNLERLGLEEKTRKEYERSGLQWVIK